MTVLSERDTGRAMRENVEIVRRYYAAWNAGGLDAARAFWSNDFELHDAPKPTVGSGANASMIGTTARSDGKPQVTYNGHPLYLYAGDQKAGDTNGQGVTAFGAAWYALSAAGNQVSGQPSSSGGSIY
jgi:ketosteroid isomerase-like protein